MHTKQELYELCERVVRVATESGLTVGTAESCTGGLVCAALTDVPGSSAAVRGGVVSYAVPVKESVLGVSQQITQDPAIGVVSKECALAMSKGAREVLGCDVSVSVTGIAGPGGEEPGKPVGTVWFGVASPNGCHTVCRHFEGTRSQVRAAAVYTAVKLLSDAVAP